MGRCVTAHSERLKRFIGGSWRSVVGGLAGERSMARTVRLGVELLRADTDDAAARAQDPVTCTEASSMATT